LFLTLQCLHMQNTVQIADIVYIYIYTDQNHNNTCKNIQGVQTLD